MASAAVSVSRAWKIADRLPAAQILDDIGQVRRMEVGQLLLGDAEMEEVRPGEELDIFPGDELIGEVIGEEPMEQSYPHLSPTRPAS